MHYFYFFLLLFAACQNPPSTKEKNNLETFKLIFKNHSFDVVRFNPTNTDLQFYLTNEKGKKFRSLQNLKSAIEAKDQQLLFAMNGGMYLKDGSPQGLYIEKGKELKQLDTIQEAYGNFYLQPNGVFYLKNKKGFVTTSKDFSLHRPDSITYATQSGPMLVINNSIHPVFVDGSKNLNIRNGVGTDEAGNIVFVISNEKVNLYDFASVFKNKLNCKNALYLDGFISKAYIPQLNRQELGGNFGVMIALVSESF